MVSQWTREGKDEHVLGTASLSVELLIKDTLKERTNHSTRDNLKAPCIIH